MQLCHQIGGGVLQVERGPAVDLALHRGAVVLGPEQLQRAGAMMRQVGVQPDPAAVFGPIHADGFVAVLMGRLTVDAEVALAAELDAGVAHVDADLLPPAGGSARRCSPAGGR